MTQPTHPEPIPTTQGGINLRQTVEGDRNQAIAQVLGGIVVYVSGGQAVFHSALTESGSSASKSTPSNTGSNPYKGLMAFQETDGDRFFGREKQISALWEKLRSLHETENAIRVLPIYGPSGSGKSSLARAGLIPELARHPIPGYDRARVAILVPGTHPLESLATVLARIVTQDLTPVAKTREFAGELKQVNETGEYDGLRRITDVIPDIAISPLVVLVDQFEEVYTLCKDNTERKAFVGNLLNAAGDGAKRVIVIVTLRSDFLGETQKHAVLNRLFSEQGYLVPAMNPEELRQAIAKPAELAGHPLDAATIDLLISDTEGRDGALPLLQFALTRIWEGLAEGKPPAETLKAIGGVGGALAGEAQRIYDSLDDDGKAIARRLFLGLVQLGEGTKDTRRRTLLDSLISYQDQPAQVKQIINLFAATGVRLITLSISGNTETAEVSHEALFEHWQQLRVWLEGSRSDIRFQRRLDEAAHHWVEQGRPEGNLWRSPDLDLLRRYQQRAGDDMTPLQVEFFNTSERSQKRSRLVRRFALGGLITGSVMITGLAVFALYQLQQAQRQRVEQLAVTSKALLSSQPGDAVIYAIAAIGLGQSVFVRFPNTSVPSYAHTSLLEAIRANREQNLLLHEGEVYSIAFSPDGKCIASGSDDKIIRLWDATTGQPIGKPLTGHEDGISSLAFSPDGKRIVSGSWDKTVRLWDATTGQPIGKPLTGHEGDVYSVAFSPDNKRILSGSKDQTIRLWDATTGQPIGNPLIGHQNWVLSVAFSLDGKRIVSGSKDQTIRLWDATTGQPIGNPLAGHEDAVKSVTFSPDSKRIVSGSDDKTVRLWDATTGQSLGKPLTGHENVVNSVAFSPDGKRIVSGSGDETVRFWDATTGHLISKPLTGHKNWIFSVAFSPDGKRIVSGSGDKTVRLWDATTGQPNGNPLADHKGEVSSIAFSPDGKRVVFGSADKSVQLWNATTGQPIGKPLIGHEGIVRSVTFSPDGKRILSSSEDKTVRLWDATTGQPIGKPLIGHEGIVRSVTFSSDGKRILSGSEDKTVRLWDATTGQPIGKPLSGHKGTVWSVAFSLDSKRILSGSEDGTMWLWDATMGQSIGKPLTGHEGAVRSVAFSPDGKRIVSGSGDKTVRLWDVTTGQPIVKPLIGHEDGLRSVVFSPDGKFIASGSWDKTVRLWDATTGQSIGVPLLGHENAVGSVSFSPDGKRIVSGSWDGTVRLWSVDWAISWESPLKYVCEQLRYYSRLTNPTTEVAKEAKQTCEQHAWNKY
ncbi:hypothetical protein H6G64_10280 [Calothrix sp. FACHB-156]|nr:hypothetical protein [Calothrix sp. FACHB-156]